jgi:transcription elongation factor GreA
VAEETFVLSPSGFARMQAEIETLQDEEKRQLVLLDEVDDDSGNLEGEEAGAYFEVKTRLEHIQERLTQLRDVVNRAEVLSDENSPKRAGLGCRVALWDMSDKSTLVVDLVTPEEARVTYTQDDGGRDVTADSPVGLALMGARVGDVIEVEVPEGKSKYTVRKIEPMP